MRNQVPVSVLVSEVMPLPLLVSCAPSSLSSVLVPASVSVSVCAVLAAAKVTAALLVNRMAPVPSDSMEFPPDAPNVN